MKSSAEAFNSTALVEKSWLAIMADLIKARLTALVLLTTLVGFYLGWQGPMNYFLMFHALFGTALVASGAAVQPIRGGKAPGMAPTKVLVQVTRLSGV